MHVGILVNQQLTAHLFTPGYVPVRLTPGLWKITIRDIYFSMYVDEFLIEYKNKKDA